MDASGPKTTVTPVRDLNNKFVTSDMHEAGKHGKWTTTNKPTFTTVAQIKKLLAKTGLPQWSLKETGTRRPSRSRPG